MIIRIIGDVHQKISKYIEIASQVENSLQIGDMGFDYSDLNVLDPTYHKVLGGNHDNYAEDENGKFYKQTKHFLGDYGIYKNMFYVGGGYSIDYKYRQIGVSWWYDEELSYVKFADAINLYSKFKPDIVVTHECPSSICYLVGGFKTWDGEPILPSRTAQALEAMLEIHRPNLWVFGHHHKDWEKVIDGTKFICLNELSYLDIEI